MPLASASTRQSAGLPYSVYETEWSVSPAETTCTRRPAMPPEVGLVPGNRLRVLRQGMLTSARNGWPPTPNCR